MTVHKNLQRDHCSLIANALIVARVTECKNVIYIIFFGGYFHFKILKMLA